MVFWGWTLRQMFPLSSLCGIGHPRRRLGASSMRYICSKGCPACHPAGQNGWKRPPETFCPPWGATYKGGEVPLSWKRTKWGLSWPFCGPATKPNPILRPKGGATHVIRPSRKTGRHTNRHWMLPILWNWILKGWAQKPAVPNTNAPTAAATLRVDSRRGMSSPQTHIGQRGT